MLQSEQKVISCNHDVNVVDRINKVDEAYINDNLIMPIIRKILAENKLPIDSYIISGITTTFTRIKTVVSSNTRCTYIHNEYGSVSIIVSLTIRCNNE